jgi:hypothetical protein
VPRTRRAALPGCEVGRMSVPGKGVVKASSRRGVGFGGQFGDFEGEAGLDAGRWGVGVEIDEEDVVAAGDGVPEEVGVGVLPVSRLEAVGGVRFLAAAGEKSGEQDDVEGDHRDGPEGEGVAWSAVGGLCPVMAVGEHGQDAERGQGGQDAHGGRSDEG